MPPIDMSTLCDTLRAANQRGVGSRVCWRRCNDVQRPTHVSQSGRADVVVAAADGEITVCECKLASNAEIRRNVIGQIFAYAAALSSFSYDDLEAAFSARNSRLADVLAPEADEAAHENVRCRASLPSAHCPGSPAPAPRHRALRVVRGRRCPPRVV